MADRVHFTGYINDEELCKMYKCVDIAVFPSLYEPFGIVALEAMVANLPVVVSEAGGFNEIVTNRFNGMKFRTGRSDLLADCIIELMTSPDLVIDITKNAWNTINEKYKWSAIVEKHMQFTNWPSRTHSKRNTRRKAVYLPECDSNASAHEAGHAGIMSEAHFLNYCTIVV